MKSVAELIERGLVWMEGSAPSGPGVRLGANGGLRSVGAAQARAERWPVIIPAPGPDGAGPSITLPPAATHEWLCDTVPHTLLTLVIRNALTQNPGRQALWIGKECWPTPQLISPILSRCLFIDPPDTKLKLWAAASALSSPGISTVLVSFPKLPFAKTRQLSLAARKGGGLGLILRQDEGPSSAASRWRVTPLPCQNPKAIPKQTFLLELLKLKGAQPDVRSWQIEFHQEVYDEEIHMRVLPADTATNATAASDLGHTVHPIRRAG